MKQGLSLVEMAQQIQDQASMKRDYIADTRQIEMNADGSLTVQAETIEEFTTTDHTHSQIAQRISIRGVSSFGTETYAKATILI